jgi:hypothetical protein
LEITVINEVSSKNIPAETLFLTVIFREPKRIIFLKLVAFEEGSKGKYVQ